MEILRVAHVALSSGAFAAKESRIGSHCRQGAIRTEGHQARHVVTTWTLKVGEIMAPKPLKTAPKAVILHTLGVEVVLTPQIPEAAVPVASCITGTPAPAVAVAAAAASAAADFPSSS